MRNTGKRVISDQDERHKKFCQEPSSTSMDYSMGSKLVPDSSQLLILLLSYPTEAIGALFWWFGIKKLVYFVGHRWICEYMWGTGTGATIT
jgi:hypothetical protein